MANYLSHTRWTDVEHADLVHMINSDFTRDEIAKVLGRTREAVSARMYAYGLKTTPKFKDGKYRCSECKVYKDKTEFYKNKSTNTGINCKCIECTRREVRAKFQEKKLKEMRDSVLDEKTKEEAFGSPTRVCTTCKVEKNIDDFNWEKKYKRVKGQCRECQNEKNRELEAKRLERRGY